MEQEERDGLLAMVRSTPDRLKAALAGVPKKRLTWRPAAGKWSIHEILCHMRDAERLGYLHRYTEIFGKDNPTFPNVDGDALALERQYRRQNLREVLRDWRAARKECLAVLKKVRGGQWTRVGTHETAGPMSLETVLQRQALGNDEAHLAQIEYIKKRWEILAKFQETPKALTALVRGVSDVVRRKPAPAKWSMLEILCHLRDVEQLFVEGGTGRSPTTTDRSFAWSIRMSWQRSCATTRTTRQWPCGSFRRSVRRRLRCSPRWPSNPGSGWACIQREGEVSFAWSVEHQVEHDANHLSQIRGLRERFVGPTPR